MASLLFYIGFPNIAKQMCSAVFRPPIEMSGESCEHITASPFVTAVTQSRMGLQGSLILEIGAGPRRGNIFIGFIL